MTAPLSPKKYPVGWWVKRAAVMFADPPELALTAAAPTVDVAAFIQPAAAAPTLTGAEPTIYAQPLFTLNPDPAQLMATGLAPAITPSTVIVTPTAASLSDTQYAPTVTVVSPVAFDAAGAGATTIGTVPISWTHTATAGAYVLVAINTLGTAVLTTVTHDGTAMTSLGSVYLGGGAGTGKLWLYGRANVAGGAKTIVVDTNFQTSIAASSVSYTGVGSVGTANTAYDSGFRDNYGNSVTVAARDMAVSFIACDYPISFTAHSGGTNRYLAYASNGQSGLDISDTTADASFSATTWNVAAYWCAIDIALHHA